MSNKKENKISNTIKNIEKIIIEGYFHFFSRHETCLFILTTISCNFQFVTKYIWYDQSLHYSLLSFYFVYKITKNYNF